MKPKFKKFASETPNATFLAGVAQVGELFEQGRFYLGLRQEGHNRDSSGRGRAHGRADVVGRAPRLMSGFRRF